MTKEIYHHQGENLPPETQHDQQSISEENLNNYWRANLGLLAKLLSVWFVVSFGCGILLADWLDQFSFFGFRLGFWFAQQGSLYVFILLIFYYARKMAALDREFNVDDKG